MFWPDLPNDTARRRLSQSLWHIGRVLEPLTAPYSYVLTEADVVRFNSSAPYWLDTQEFQRLLSWEPWGRSLPTGSSLLDDEGRDDTVSERYAQRAPTVDDLDELTRLRRAVSLYQGDFMSGCYDEWLLAERERLREVFLSALDHLVQRCKARSLFEEALSHARRLAEADPLREEAHREVMRLCSLLDRPNEARRQFEICSAMLAKELEAEPSPSTLALHQDIISRSQASEQTHIPRARDQLASPLLETTGRVSLVGREREQALLTDLLEGAMAGWPGVVLLEGEAGVGKTRLLEELARDAEWRGAQVLWGRGREAAEAPPYQPLADALSSALSPLRARLLAQSVPGPWLRAACVALPQLAGWLPELPPHLGLGTEIERDRLLEALTRIVLALSRTTPLVLLIEDLQWVDEPSLDALRALAGALCTTSSPARERPVLLIGSYRSGEARERLAVWQTLQAMDRQGVCHRLQLLRLSEQETGELVRHALGLRREAPRFEARLFQETDGNPLFVVETLRALHDEGLLYRSATGDWSTPWDGVTTDYAELPLPSKVQQVISRRLQRLGPDEQEMLQSAAVLGSHGDVDLLVQATGLEQEWALRALGELVQRRLLQETADGLRFSHDRVREVTLLEMDPAAQREAHRRVGEVLQALRPEAVEAIAGHLVAAEAWDLALPYCRRAGDQARAAYAGNEAIGHYSQALGIWERLSAQDPGQVLALRLARGETAQETGRFDLAEADFRTAWELAREAGDMAAQARAVGSLSYVSFQRGDCPAAERLAQESLNLAESAGAPLQVARALLNRANALRNLGRPDEAITLYQRAVDRFSELGDDAMLADGLNRMGYAYIFLGDYAEAQRAMDESLALRRQLDDRVGISYSLTNLTALHYVQGRLSDALQSAEEAVEIARAIGDPYGEDAALFNVGLIALERGSPTAALSHFEKTLAIADRIGDGPVVAETLAEIGRTHYHLRDHKRARQLLVDAVERIASGGECWHEPKTHAYLSQTLLALGDAPAAMAEAQAGLQRAQMIGDPWSLGLTHRAVALAAAVSDASADDISSREHFEESIRLLRQVGARAELARSLAAYGRFLASSPDEADRGQGTRLLGEAQTHFEDLGMELDLADLYRASSSAPHIERIEVRLPSAAAPTGRPLRADEWVMVTWTVGASSDQAVEGKVARRQHQLLRLLDEAVKQDGAPTVDDLAQALDVSRATIKRDLAALRQAGHTPRTRGTRSI